MAKDKKTDAQELRERQEQAQRDQEENSPDGEALAAEREAEKARRVDEYEDPSTAQTPEQAAKEEQQNNEPRVGKNEIEEPADLEHVTMADAEYWCTVYGVEPEGLQHALKMTGSDNPDVIRTFIVGS